MNSSVNSTFMLLFRLLVDMATSLWGIALILLGFFVSKVFWTIFWVIFGIHIVLGIVAAIKGDRL